MYDPELGYLTGQDYADLFAILTGRWPKYVPTVGYFPNRKWARYYNPEKL